jgi:hypothetical protein
MLNMMIGIADPLVPVHTPAPWIFPRPAPKLGMSNSVDTSRSGRSIELRQQVWEKDSTCSCHLDKRMVGPGG